MPEYIVNQGQAVRMDGRDYREDSTLNLSEAEAHPMVSAGVIRKYVKAVGAPVQEQTEAEPVVKKGKKSSEN